MIRVFRVFFPSIVFILLVSEFLLLAFCYVLAAFLVLEVDPWVFLLYDGGLARIVPVIITILFGLQFLDLYTQIGGRSRAALLLEIGQAIGLAFVVQAMLGYGDRNWILPRWMMIYGSAFSLVCLTGWRVIYEAVVYRAFGAHRVLFLGRNLVVEDIAEYLERHPEVGLTNVGYADDSRAPGTVLNGAPVLGPVRNLREIAGQTKPDRIMVGMSERRTRLPVQDLLDLKFSGTVIEDATVTYETVRRRICTKELRPSQLIFSGELGTRRGRVLLQLVYSLGIAVIATILLAPLMLLVAVAIKLTSRGPVLYHQTRVGLNETTFVVNKFRSMYAEAEAETGAVWATKDDPRVTPLGRWLRKLRLDELPQLFNVLRGEMSIVGPRPERPEFAKVLAEQIPFYPQRHCVKPGITGWAQINYRYGETVEDAIVKLEYDLYYIKHLSPALDAYIIFQTVQTMLRLRGAQ
jgi:exopolysaccharide biosynthesis polyprenyl glycosylphosphotransferase